MGYLKSLSESLASTPLISLSKSYWFPDVSRQEF